MSELTIGQNLYFASNLSHIKNKEVTVKTIGRKWVNLSDYMRMDKQTWQVENRNYSCLGYCYLSEQHYKEEKAKKDAFKKLKRVIQYAELKDGVTIDDIEAAMKLLRI